MKVITTGLKDIMYYLLLTNLLYIVIKYTIRYGNVSFCCDANRYTCQFDKCPNCL